MKENKKEKPFHVNYRSKNLRLTTLKFFNKFTVLLSSEIQMALQRGPDSQEKSHQS